LMDILDERYTSENVYMFCHRIDAVHVTHWTLSANLTISRTWILL
jgi:hypothetical protein